MGRYVGRHRRIKRPSNILCGECTLILPNGNQDKPKRGEQCDVCGKVG